MFSGTLEVGSVVRKDSGRRATSGDEPSEGSQEIFCGQGRTQVEMHIFGEKAYEYHDVTLDQGGFPGVSSPAGEGTGKVNSNTQESWSRSCPLGW